VLLHRKMNARELAAWQEKREKQEHESRVKSRSLVLLTPFMQFKFDKGRRTFFLEVLDGKTFLRGLTEKPEFQVRFDEAMRRFHDAMKDFNWPATADRDLRDQFIAFETELISATIASQMIKEYAREQEHDLDQGLMKKRPQEIKENRDRVIELFRSRVDEWCNERWEAFKKKELEKLRPEFQIFIAEVERLN
jgi:hypothetical protein